MTDLSYRTGCFIRREENEPNERNSQGIRYSWFLSLSHAHTQTYTHPSHHTCSSGNTGYIQRGLLYALWEEEEEAGTLYT